MPRWCWLGLLAGLSGGLAAQDWQPLLTNSPFGQVTAATTGAPGELEFRGVVQEEGQYFVNLFNPTTKTSQWVAVNGKAPGLEVKSYDATAEKVQVTQGGRALSLPLKQAKVTLAKVAVPPPPGEGGKEDKDERKGEIREMIRARLEAAGGDPVQMMRNMPPEAQAMMEEFRRRRAERAENGEGGGSSKGSLKPEKTNSSKNNSSKNTVPTEAPLRTRRQP